MADVSDLEGFAEVGGTENEFIDQPSEQLPRQTPAWDAANDSACSVLPVQCSRQGCRPAPCRAREHAVRHLRPGLAVRRRAGIVAGGSVVRLLLELPYYMA